MVVFKPTVREAVISSAAERNGERATDLCWNDNSTELYIGGANGTVHVMGLSIFTVRKSFTERKREFSKFNFFHHLDDDSIYFFFQVKRGIFQNPACPIMGLDYKVVQMDFSSPLLLVSTISDCYICDTIQGQYEKVGVRTRQGEFGACFYKPGLGREFDVQITEEKKFLPQGNSEFEETEIYGNDKQYPRIYCARPGSRLWEAKPNGKIVKTHNFKEALAIPPSVVRKIRDETINSSFTETDESCCWQLKSLKFSPLHIIANEYLFTYNTNALYILDPVKSIVILWCNEYADIKIGKVIDNKIYLMRKSGDFHCLELRQINEDNFKTKNKSFNKLNNSSLVVVNKISTEQISKGIKSLVSSLEFERNNDRGNNFLPSEFENDVKKSEINEENLVEDNLKLYKSKKLYDKTVPDVGKINFNENIENKLSQRINDETDRIDIEKESKDKIKNLLTDVQNIYYLANSIKITMSDNEIDTIIINLKETINRIEKSYKKLNEQKPNVFKAIETAEQYYRTTFLSVLSKRGLNGTTNDNIFDEIIESFLKINESEYSECECGFPYYHKTEFLEPKFLDVGLSILERYLQNDKNICLNFCKKVPYMWRIYLTSIENYFDGKIFAQLLQTRDELILSFIVISLNPKQWEFVRKVISNMENELCLICSKSIKENDNREDKNLSINWNNVANEIIKRKGPEVAVNFLKKLINELPSVSLNQRYEKKSFFSAKKKNSYKDSLMFLFL